MKCDTADLSITSGKLSTSGTLDYGTKVYVECESGFVAIGNGIAECQIDGSFTDIGPVECRDIIIWNSFNTKRRGEKSDHLNFQFQQYIAQCHYEVVYTASL